MNVISFAPGGTVTLSATTSSSTVALSSGTGQSVEVQNSGSVVMFVKLGASTITAAVTDYPILAGQSKIITRDSNNQTYIACITSTSTATGYATIGEGV